MIAHDLGVGGRDLPSRAHRLRFLRPTSDIGNLHAVFAIGEGHFLCDAAPIPFNPRRVTMNDTASETQVSKEKLVRDLQRVISDAEELLHATAGQTEGKVVELRERIRGNLMDARHKLGDIEDAVKGKTKEVARATDDYVHEHPWLAIGTAASVGLVLGLLISRR
jgi:ElaB/YqjD/DUF883 family membrane-anchored ribosome-binding protein